jgi:hypothetical protein
VQAGAAGLNEGTFEDPFSALPATQEADIIYLHADSVFSGQSYTLAADQRLLGEGSGNLHLVDTDQLGDIVLPDGSGGANRPVFDAAAANAVTLAGEGNEVSNIAITNAVGSGIFGNGVNDFDINRNVITGSGGRGIFLSNVAGDVETNFIGSGRIADNVVTNSVQQNIQLVLAGDFEGEVTGNTASGSAASQGISVTSLFRFDGDISNNIADGNFLDGILVDVEEFFGDVNQNTTTSNQADGILLVIGSGDVEIAGNTASLNGDNGIDLNITGDFFSDVDVLANTADDNGAEGISLTFGGTGTSTVEVLNNDLSGNFGGIDREFIAQVEDVFGSSPVVYIELDGNTSTNVLGLGPPFNFEFENSDLFADGQMFVELGTNVGTVGLGEGVEPGQMP